ncbi:hypothetical protein [Falsirhodobacter sp. 20TX0035]|uniref:hypothetical protein n=1 Tax=Falsirhodobacter sp. 20TX0035 TaxID=3022019 RepID=UPI00233086E9|nr:hypothetical protein [Falsirhodobacter sp. 20TX0035]MDB6455139.1 hypothetical protein [Falsirhodobacter sp. 20TX0035]
MLIAVNAAEGSLVERRTGSLDEALSHLPATAPVTLLIHGYRYAPQADDPFAGLLGPAGWPRRLGFGRGQTGLCIAFCWNGSGTLWQANRRAAEAGHSLARLIRTLRARHDGPLGLLTHSLGARVGLSALPHLGAHDVTRMVLLAGAEFRDTAEAALAGTATEVLNITSRENDGYDVLYENLIAPFSGRRTISTLPSGPRVATLQIDHRGHRHALASLGFPTRPPDRRICHWSSYQRAGLFRLYRRFLLAPQTLPMATLRAALPEGVTPRWSRLRGTFPEGQRFSTP